MNLVLETLSKIPLVLLFVISGVFVVTGDTLSKTWTISRNNWVAGLALIAYMAAGLFFIPLLTKEKLAVANVIWNIVNILGTIVVSILLFKEVLTPIQIVGVILGIIAIFLLSV